MRTSLIISLLLSCLIFTSCSQSGDFSGFFVGEITKYGGHPKAGVTISRLDARWTIQSDADGFRILVRGQPFAAIDALMQQVFGAPRVSVASDNEGHPHQVYGSADIGVAVQCIGHTNDVEIICARGPFVGGTK